MPSQVAALPDDRAQADRTARTDGNDNLCQIRLQQLKLRNFRNHRQIDLSTDSNAVILTGPNGAGKTNILEAISLLAPGRGLRRAKTDMLAYRPTTSEAIWPAAASTGNDIAAEEIAGAAGCASWSVSALLETAEGPIRAGTGSTADAATASRQQRLNGAAASQADLAACFAISWLTPEMDGVLSGAASGRRRFLDRLVISFDPAHAGRLNRHEKLLRQRNRLLEAGSGDDHWHQALEAQLAEVAVAIIAARLTLTQALDEMAAIPVPGFPAGRLKLAGSVEDWLRKMPAVDVEDRIRAEARETRLGGALAMPSANGSLLTVTHSATGQPAELCSTGEEKALLVGLVLAHARLQTARLQRPLLLLLDDIASHLDGQRRDALFAMTATLPGQVWYSGTEWALFAGFGPAACHIDVGTAARCRRSIPGPLTRTG